MRPHEVKLAFSLGIRGALIRDSGVPRQAADAMTLVCATIITNSKPVRRTYKSLKRRMASIEPLVCCVMRANPLLRTLYPLILACMIFPIVLCRLSDPSYLYLF